MSLISTAKSALPRARQSRPFLDHLVRTYTRYQADGGDRLAAAVTFYWFLSLFPILLLAIAVLGYVYGDTAPQRVAAALGGYLPAQLVDTIGTTLVDAKGKAGVLGLAGLLLSGLGWVDGLREAIRSIWHQDLIVGNIVTRKLIDIVVLVGLFATIAASVFITGATTAATGYVIGLLGLTDTTTAAVLTQLLAYALSAFADALLFLYMFTRLPRVSQPLRRVVRSAVFGAIGFGIIKFAGAFYVARTTSRGAATYGAFAVVVGLLLFLNLVSRWILMTAAFAVTRPYDSDARPSGTAGRETPQPAPAPSVAAPSAPPPVASASARSPGRGEALARNAGRVGAAAIGVLMAAVGIYAARTVRSVVTRR